MRAPVGGNYEDASNFEMISAAAVHLARSGTIFFIYLVESDPYMYTNAINVKKE